MSDHFLTRETIWKFIKPKYRFIAVDRFGNIGAFTARPILLPTLGGWFDRVMSFHSLNALRILPWWEKWEDSLIERPVSEEAGA